METTTARVTPGTHNPSISAQTVRNRLREAGLRACRPVVRQVLTRHHWQLRRLWAQTHRRWTRKDFTDESRFCLTRGDGRFAFIVKGMSVTPRPVLWSGIDLEVEGPSWSGVVCHSIIGLSLLEGLCIPGVTRAVVVAILYLSRRCDVRMYRCCAGGYTWSATARTIICPSCLPVALS